jgi:hypothetical protein
MGVLGNGDAVDSKAVSLGMRRRPVVKDPRSSDNDLESISSPRGQ